jgi:RNA polymerase sigma-70 factor (ECF subfamily)
MSTTMARDADAARVFSELIERHRGIVYKVAHAYARTAWDRDDLAQEIAAQLWRAFPNYDAQRKFSTWMYRVALNVAISFVRGDARRAKHTVPFDAEAHDVADPLAGDPAEDDKLEMLNAFIARLDPLNRALLLMYLDDVSQREIADVLGITETNVATKVGRLKQRFRREAGVDDSQGERHGAR